MFNVVKFLCAIDRITFNATLLLWLFSELPTSGLNFQFKARSSSLLAGSPVTSESGSTSGVSGIGSNGSSNGSDTTLVNAEETYTSSLFQTEPLYQFYDVGDGIHNNQVSLIKF